jgi:hypothetical protein
MKHHCARCEEEIADLVMAGADPQTHTKRAIEIAFGDKKVVGTYCTAESVRPGTVLKGNFSPKERRSVMSLVTRLIEEGITFVTRHGSDDTLHELRWSLEG